MLSVLLLGPPQVLLDGRLRNIPRRKSRALLYYLAAHRAPLTREHLLNLFWPDLERPAARQTLRSSLYGLHTAIGPALLAEGDRVALEAEVDAAAFEADLTTPHPQPAAATLDLYRGDFLADFSLPDVPAFEDWAALERERFRRLALRGLAALSRQHEARGDYAAALEAIHRALAFDPLQEDLQRTALRLQTLAGDRAGAIRRYDALRWTRSWACRPWPRPAPCTTPSSAIP